MIPMRIRTSDFLGPSGPCIALPHTFTKQRSVQQSAELRSEFPCGKLTFLDPNDPRNMNGRIVLHTNK